jgi:hypothetical protein
VLLICRYVDAAAGWLAGWLVSAGFGWLVIRLKMADILILSML